MKKIKYEIIMGYDVDYKFYMDGKIIDEDRDIAYETTCGSAKLSMLHILANAGVIELEEIK